jgi:hypothetical protein
MKYELTIFKNQFDNKTHRRVSMKNWDQFLDLLYGLSKREGQKGGKNSSPLITPAVFEDGTTRSNKSTLYWGSWCAVDVDSHNFSNDLATLKEQLYDELGNIDYCVYSTASSRSDHVKFRIVFRLDEQIEASRIKAFWFALNTWLGEIGDPQTKDLARMYYVPAIYPDAFGFIFDNRSGVPLNVSELISKYPYAEKTGNSFLDRLPLEIQKAVVQHRKESLDNTNISWTDYRDCPFFPKQLAMQYQTITDTGWYHKMYQIMVATAANAIKRGYPITAKEVANLCRQLDNDNGMWYSSRPLEVEADRAVEYAYRNA